MKSTRPCSLRRRQAELVRDRQCGLLQRFVIGMPSGSFGRVSLYLRALPGCRALRARASSQRPSFGGGMSAAASVSAFANAVARSAAERAPFAVTKDFSSSGKPVVQSDAGVGVACGVLCRQRSFSIGNGDEVFGFEAAHAGDVQPDAALALLDAAVEFGRAGDRRTGVAEDGEVGFEQRVSGEGVRRRRAQRRASAGPRGWRWF